MLFILTVVFVVLKLTEVIAWSWWLVLSPALFGLFLVIVSGSLFIAMNSYRNKALGSRF